jgi:hypothetical protein
LQFQKFTCHSNFLIFNLERDACLNRCLLLEWTLLGRRVFGLVWQARVQPGVVEFFWKPGEAG